MSDAVDEAQAMEARIRAVEVATARAVTAGIGAEDCETCGEPIPEDRQRAVPWATRCICCQEAAERREKGLA